MQQFITDIDAGAVFDASSSPVPTVWFRVHAKQSTIGYLSAGARGARSDGDALDAVRRAATIIGVNDLSDVGPSLYRLEDVASSRQLAVVRFGFTDVLEPKAPPCSICHIHHTGPCQF